MSITYQKGGGIADIPQHEFSGDQNRSGHEERREEQRGGLRERGNSADDEGLEAQPNLRHR
jgi:hypothetical protein